MTMTLRNPVKLPEDAGHLLDDETDHSDEPSPEEEQDPSDSGQGRSDRHQGLWTEVHDATAQRWEYEEKDDSDENL